MRRTPWRAVSLVLVLGLALLSCDGPNRGTNTQPSVSGFQIVVVVSPNTLRAAEPGSERADGGCAVILVKVFDTQGQLVDGVLATVTVTLGVLKVGDDEFVSVGDFTVNGLMDVAFCAKDERGTGIITATVQDAVATTTVTIF